jgi:hypothetical protein
MSKMIKVVAAVLCALVAGPLAAVSSGGDARRAPAAPASQRADERAGSEGVIFTLAGGGPRAAAPGVLATDASISAYAMAATPAHGLIVSDGDRVFRVGRHGRLQFLGGAEYANSPGGGAAIRGGFGLRR